MTPDQKTEALMICAKPLWEIENALAHLPWCVAAAAKITGASNEQVTEAARFIDEASFAIEQLHKLGADAATADSVPLEELNRVAVRSGAGGNKPD